MPTSEDEVNQGLASLEVAFGSKKEGDLDAARCFFSRAALKIPKTHDSYPICLSQLAEIDERNEDWLGALRFNLNLLVEMEHRYGERDEQTIGVMDKAASLFEKVGRKDESLALYERSRSLSQRSLWADQTKNDVSNFEQSPSVPSSAVPHAQNPQSEISLPAEMPPGANHQSSTVPSSVQPPSAESLVMLEAFENAYRPYLTPELIGPEDISLDYLDRKMNLKGRLSKMRVDAETAKSKEEDTDKAFAALRAQLAKALSPLLGFISKHLTDRNKVLLTIFVSVSLLIGLAFLLLHYARNVAFVEQYERVPHTFISADGQKSFIWLDKNTCELVSGSERAKVRTRNYSGNFGSLIEMAVTPIIQNQFWIDFEPTRVVDQDGGVMYADAGPESRLTEVLQAITRGATYVFLEKKDYPISFASIVDALKDHERNVLSFVNQYTGDAQKPVLKTISFKAKNNREGDQWRSNLIEKFNQGELVEGEEKFAPGEPRAYSITDTMPRGVIKFFIVRAADRDGQILRGNAAGKFNYIALDEGKQLNSAKTPPFFGTQPPVRQRVVWILQKPISDTDRLLIRNGGTVVSFVLCFALAAAYLSTFNRGFWKTISLLCAVCMLLLTIAYYGSPFIP